MPSSSNSNVLHSHRDSNFLHSEADITEFFTATTTAIASPAPKCPNFMGVHEVFVKMPQSPPSSLLHDT
ncbi:unnamed protein product, partial [Ilex paraguariensis]